MARPETRGVAHATGCVAIGGKDALRACGDACAFADLGRAAATGGAIAVGGVWEAGWEEVDAGA